MFTNEDVVTHILLFYMRTLIDSESSERRFEGLRVKISVSKYDI